MEMADVIKMQNRKMSGDRKGGGWSDLGLRRNPLGFIHITL